MKIKKLLIELSLFLLAFIAMTLFLQAQDITVTPSPLDSTSITANIGGLNLPTLAWIGLGFLGYFITRFRIAFATDATTKFNLGEWFTRNWLNTAYFLGALAAIQFFKVELSWQNAILLGSSPNLLIDWIQRELKAVSLLAAK
jgi:hypothetical protein